MYNITLMSSDFYSDLLFSKYLYISEYISAQKHLL